jgi:hypothetical protein
MFKEEPIATHWEGCEEGHPECKIAKLNKRIAELEMLLRNNGWISTTKSLPKIGEPVLLMTSEGYVFIGYRGYDRGCDERWVACIGCYGDCVIDFRWLPDPDPLLHDYGLVAYWKEVTLPPRDIMRRVATRLSKLQIREEVVKEDEDKD